jgi:hypothetical protein
MCFLGFARFSKAFVVMSFAVFLIWTPINAHGQPKASDLKARFMAEAPIAWQEYLAKSQQVQGSATTKVTRVRTDKKLGEAESVFRQADGCAYVSSRSVMEENKNGKKRETPKWELNGENPRYRFSLHRKDELSAWVLTGVHVDTENEKPATPFEFNPFNLIKETLSAPVTLHSNRVDNWPAMLSSRELVIGAVELEPSSPLKKAP